MQTRAVVFDRDGVLTYFDVEYAQSFFRPLLPLSLFELAKRWQEWGMEVGFPATVEEELTFFSGFWRQLRQEYEMSEAQYRTLATCNYTDFMRSYPEVSEVLRELKERKIAVGVLSNFSLATLESSLVAVGLREWIDVACAATVIGYSKPDPRAYRHVAQLLHVENEATLFLDDEIACVEGAQRVGMVAYLVDRKRDQDDFANHLLRNLNAVPNLLY